MLIQKTCRYLAKITVENVDSQLTEYTIYKRLSILFISLLSAITIICVGLIFDLLLNLIIVTIAFAFIRILNGGNHFKSPDLCFLVSTSVILINPLLQFVLFRYEFYIFIICLILYGLFAPHDYFKKNNTRKIILLFGLILSSIFSKEFLYTYFILIPDLLINNAYIKKWRII